MKGEATAAETRQGSFLSGQNLMWLEGYVRWNVRGLAVQRMMEIMGRSPRAYKVNIVLYLVVRPAYRCDFVATIFATVCARVEPGLT